MESLLTAKTSALCFNKDDFMLEDFYVDKFVSNCRKFSSLETMQEDLGIYHKILCSAMVELINKDYSDFLNLSSNLVGLDKSINVLSIPLQNLKDEVKDVKGSLEGTLITTKTEFSDYSNAYKKKVLAHHALSVLEGLEKIQDLNSLSLTSDKIPPDVLERIALDFNTVDFHLSKISNLKNVEGKRMALQEVASNLKNHLEKHFLQSLSENDAHRLFKVLRIYALLDKESELENFFAKTVVKPYMEHHITEENILRYGLSKVYDNVLKFISKSTMILNATKGTKNRSGDDIVPGYDILVNAVFPQIVHCFELIFSAPIHTHVYSPGNPELFHSNYTSTILFLDQFEHFCQVQTSVKRLRQHELYECFLNKWNLDVYYEVRFSEIAGKFEKSVLEGIVFLKNTEGKKSKNSRYLLNISCSLSECINLSYEEKIFLSPLSHHFFRLNLQLVSRFYQSVCRYLKSDFLCQGKNSVDPVEAAAMIRDVELLIIELKKLFEHKVCLKLQREIVEVSFQQSVKLLEDIIPLASSLMIKSLTKECYAHLKLISDIPRLYRKTNREIPSKPSNYVSLIFKKLTDFIAETESILPPKSKKFCLEEVTNGIIVQCVIMVKEVLTSIEKMQNSLKILRRDRTRDKYSTGMSPDDAKIYKQLIIDLNCIEENARDLGLDIDSLKSFKELKDIMNSTKKILPQS